MSFQRHPVAAALAALVACTLASAQGTAPAAASGSDAAVDPARVVITGGGRPQTAATAPFNINALNEEALRQNNVGDLKSLIQLIPAISAPDNPARFADSVTARGLNVSPANANNLEQFVRSTIAYYLDDAPLPNIGYRIKDIARVETLLGPQGTLYGAGSLGGTIRYITNQPDFAGFEGRANLSLYQTRGGGLSNDVDGVVNVPLGGAFALRASVARLDEKGHTDRISNPPWRTGSFAWTTKPDAARNVYEDDDWQRVDGGRIALAFQPFKGLKFTLSHAEQKQLANGTSATSLLPLGVANARSPAERDDAWQNPEREVADFPCQPNCRFTDEFTAPAAGPGRSIVSRYPEFADRRFRLSAFDIDADLGFADLRSSTSVFRDARIGQADYASQGFLFYGPESSILQGFDLGGSILSDRSAYITFDNTYKGSSHETRLTSKGAGALAWIAGLYHTKQQKSLKFAEVLPGMDAYLGADKFAPSPLPDLGYDEDLSSTYQETALYGELSWRITAPWAVTVGARAFRYDDTARARINDYAGGVVDSDFTFAGGKKNDSFYKFNTSYQFTPDLLGYLTFSQGFRRGGSNGFKDLSNGRVVAPEVREYQPDSTDNLELGIKGWLVGKTLWASLAVYRIDWRNTQTYFSQSISGFPVNGTANGPDSRSRGLEAELRLTGLAGFTLAWSGATTEAKWAETKTLCLYVNGTGCRTWNAGFALGGAPKWKHNASVRYDTSIGSAGRYAFALLGVRHQGKVQSDRVDNEAQARSVLVYPSITRYNVRAGIGQAPWEAVLWADNLGDERKIVSNQNAGIMGRRIITTTPRTIGLNLSYAF